MFFSPQSQTDDIPGSKMDLSVGAYILVSVHLKCEIMCSIFIRMICCTLEEFDLCFSTPHNVRVKSIIWLVCKL